MLASSLVDDHPLTSEGLSLAARAALPGAHVTTASLIAEAAAAMSGKRRFRLIVQDYVRPNSRGYAGMLRLQQLDLNIPDRSRQRSRRKQARRDGEGSWSRGRLIEATSHRRNSRKPTTHSGRQDDLPHEFAS